MESLAGAVSLMRALLALGRAERSGVLRVQAGKRRASVALVQGVPRAVDLTQGDAKLLGDMLLRAGDLDAGRHAAALPQGEPTSPVGDWLVQRGLASRPAVELALRRQLRARLLSVLRWEGLEYRFEPGSGCIGMPGVSEPIPVTDLVLHALRSLVATLPSAVRAERVRDGGLELAPLGHRLLREAALWPEEAALAQLLRRSAARARIMGHVDRYERAQILLCALLLLGAVRERDARYGLLLRKRAQVRRAETPRALLDLPDHAGVEQGRRALHRLALELHPDRVGERVAATSNDVLRALLEAERALRSRAAGSLE